MNGGTIRRLPTVTEICVFYRRRLELAASDGSLMSARRWLRSEWQRTGLSLYRANDACGVKNAATRKYLTQDWLWYFPPAEMMGRLVAYANEHEAPGGGPYYHTSSLRRYRIAGIPAEHWISFFKLHAEATDHARVLDRLSRDPEGRGLDGEAAADVAEAIFRIVDRFG